MKNKNNKIVIGIILSLSVIGIGTFVYINNKTPEEVTVVENVKESTPAEEEVIEEVEEEAEGKKINAFDAQLFYESQNEPSPIVSTEYWEESEAESTEVKEPEIEIIESAESVPADEEPAASTEIVQTNVNEAGYYDSDSDKTDFERVPVSCVDFSNNANLITLQSEVNPLIDADGGCTNAFTLENGRAVVAYVGKDYFVDCEIKVTSSPAKTTLTVNCNLNDISWKCMSAVMEEVYPGKGTTLVSECRKACESGSSVYSSFDTWNEFNGIHTKVVLAENGDSLVFVFR